MVTVAPLNVIRCLFLNSLRVRVIVSRVEPTHSAICSWVNAILIWAPSEVCASSEDQSRNKRATFSSALVDRPTVRNCSQARAVLNVQLSGNRLVHLWELVDEAEEVLPADKRDLRWMKCFRARPRMQCRTSMRSNRVSPLGGRVGGSRSSPPLELTDNFIFPEQSRKIPLAGSFSRNSVDPSG